MSKSDYFEKYKDPRWQKKRLEILQKNDWRCYLCDTGEETLHVHHIYYVYGRDPWEYEDDALVVLCEECHEIEHDCKDRLFDDIKLMVRKKNFLYSDFSRILFALDKSVKNRRKESLSWIMQMISDKKIFSELSSSHPGIARSMRDSQPEDRQSHYREELIKRINKLSSDN